MKILREYLKARKAKAKLRAEIIAEIAEIKETHRLGHMAARASFENGKWPINYIGDYAESHDKISKLKKVLATL